MEDWTPVDIRHRNPIRVQNSTTLQEQIVIDSGEDVSEWLRERSIRWCLNYSMKTMRPEPVLFFEHERDAVLFALRWA